MDTWDATWFCRPRPTTSALVRRLSPRRVQHLRPHLVFGDGLVQQAFCFYARFVFTPALLPERDIIPQVIPHPQFLLLALLIHERLGSSGWTPNNY
eukprot:8712419-Pyramimonas_sp.AAC.1